MPSCLFASDLHGDSNRYARLFAELRGDPPAALFLGGDLLPSGLGLAHGQAEFLDDVLAAGLRSVRERLGSRYPRVFVILGNDDPRVHEPRVFAGETEGLWTYAHGRRSGFGDLTVLGYACVPPTPFQLKDWERYDVSRHVDPGCVSPEEGMRSVAVEESETRWGTILADLDRLAGERDLGRAILLLHAPPHDTALDRAALDGRRIDHVPLDVHVGSIAIRRFIERRRPLLTLHGHVHEAARLTGTWHIRLGETHCISAAHDGPELALVRFDPDRLDRAARDLLPVT